MNITYNELIHSDTAKSKGIDNTPTDEAKENLKNLMTFLNSKVAPHYKPPVYVNSGYRCQSLNKAVGGASTSHHQLGYAADLTCGDVVMLRDIIKSKFLGDIDQLIYYPKRNFIHISIHPTKRGEYFEK